MYQYFGRFLKYTRTISNDSCDKVFVAVYIDHTDTAVEPSVYYYLIHDLMRERKGLDGDRGGLR